jgi:hypothetical protein
MDADYFIVFKYVINRNYAFFAAVVMLITIAITLSLFFSYHLYLVKLNVTTNEKVKRTRMQKYMDLIIKTINQIIKEKKLDYQQTDNNKELTKEEVDMFKDIAFNSNKIYLYIIHF